MKNGSILAAVLMMISSPAFAQSAPAATYSLHCQVMAFQMGKGYQVIASDDQPVAVEEVKVGPDTGSYSPKGSIVNLQIKSQAGEAITIQGVAYVEIAHEDIFGNGRVRDLATAGLTMRVKIPAKGLLLFQTNNPFELDPLAAKPGVMVEHHEHIGLSGVNEQYPISCSLTKK